MEQEASDMLVRLYGLPTPAMAAVDASGSPIAVRRALVTERDGLVSWVRRAFGEQWANECEVAFATHPVRCVIAVTTGAGPRTIGFCVYDSIALGVAGPLGVDPEFTGRGVGSAVLLRTLWAMREQGYAYAILGWIAPAVQPFFHAITGAEVIAGSCPKTGMYDGLRRDPLLSNQRSST